MLSLVILPQTSPVFPSLTSIDPLRPETVPAPGNGAYVPAKHCRPGAHVRTSTIPASCQLPLAVSFNVDAQEEGLQAMPAVSTRREATVSSGSTCYSSTFDVRNYNRLPPHAIIVRIMWKELK